MEMTDYQNKISEFYLFDRGGLTHMSYALLNTVGEIGELQGLLAKYHRDHSHNDPEGEYFDIYVAPNVRKELGDCLFMIHCLIDAFQLDANTIAKENIQKLTDRKARNTIGGSGDDR